MPGKKLVKNASNLASLCETDWLGVGKDIEEVLKFYENELRI
jgi:hypothetical protein